MSVLAQAVESAPFDFTLDAWAVVLISSVFIPLIVGIFTKANASPWVKSLVNLILTGVATLIAANINDTGQAVLSKETLMVWIIGMVASVGAYLGIYQNLPTPEGEPDGINSVLAPNFGLGGSKEG